VVPAPGHVDDFEAEKPIFPKWNFFRPGAVLVGAGGLEAMLIERGLQVMNVEVVGDAYGIASNYLRKAGAMSETIVTDDRLLEIIVGLFQRGEFNRIKLANKAIVKFEAERLIIDSPIAKLSA
jgi:hypothetical protein